MPKEVRIPAHSSRQYRNQPYETHTGITNVPASNTMEAMNSPPTAHMGGQQNNFMASPVQERASAAWTEEDDQRLMECRAKGQNWVVISEKFPGKTGNACRKRHERLIEKRQVNHLDGVRLADLATAYVECREIMWKMVAERVGGQKWQVIEQKCMEKGVKTLTTNARAQRRNQSHHHLPTQGIDASPERNDEQHMEPQFVPDPFYGVDMGGKVHNSYYQAFGAGQQDMNASFYANQAAANAHSRRASAAHSVGHSVEAPSRAGSHGPMQPPQATNPFASPHQVQTQYFSPGNGTLAMAPTLSSQHFPATTMAAGMHQPHGSSTSGLPSIQSAFDVPRLPSIMSSQG